MSGEVVYVLVHREWELNRDTLRYDLLHATELLGAYADRLEAECEMQRLENAWRPWREAAGFTDDYGVEELTLHE